MSFQKRISTGEFAVLAEMNPPKGVDISKMVLDSRRIKGRVDAVVVPDMDNGVMTMSALGSAVLMQQQGLEAIIHVYCRDRNRMALQGDLLAAHVLGIQNLIVVRSEDMANGDHRDAKPVFDISELEFLEAIASLQSGRDMAGFELNGKPELFAGCTITLCADAKQQQAELDLVKRKIDAGARFVVTPPVFDVEALGGFLESAGNLGVPVIATVFLLKSVAIARYIANSEPEAHISEAIIRRIRKSPDREMEGIKIAAETVSALKKTVQGVKIQTVGWEHRLPVILDMAGI